MSDGLMNDEERHCYTCQVDRLMMMKYMRHYDFLIRNRAFDRGNTQMDQSIDVFVESLLTLCEAHPHLARFIKIDEEEDVPRIIAKIDFYPLRFTSYLSKREKKKYKKIKNYVESKILRAFSSAGNYSDSCDAMFEVEEEDAVLVLTTEYDTDFAETLKEIIACFKRLERLNDRLERLR
jgi:hypothetical protein